MTTFTEKRTNHSGLHNHETVDSTTRIHCESNRRLSDRPTDEQDAVNTLDWIQAAHKVALKRLESIFGKSAETHHD